MSRPHEIVINFPAEQEACPLSWPRRNGTATRSPHATWPPCRRPRAQSQLIGDLHHQLRIHRINDDRARLGGVGAHHDIARKQQPNLAIDINRAMGQRRIAGTQDQIVLDVLAEFGLQRGLTSISVSTPNP